MRHGVIVSREKRERFENPSLPGPSAGRIPELIDGDYVYQLRMSYVYR